MTEKISTEELLNLIRECSRSLEARIAAYDEERKKEQDAKDVEFEVFSGEEFCASVTGPGGLKEALHYARQYAVDTPAEIYQVRRKLVAELHVKEGRATVHLGRLMEQNND